MAGSLHGFENPEQGVPPVDRRERDEWRYQEEKGRVDAVGWAYSIVDCREDNLLDNSGDYTSLTLYISTVCNRIKLEISISDPDALLTVERHDVTADTWAEVLVIAAGTVKALAMPAHDELRLKINAATGAYCASTYLAAKYVKGG